MMDNHDYDRMLKEAPERTFVTVCGEDTALWKADGSLGELYICLQGCSQEEYQRIRAQADEWVLREECEEWYDYDFYANSGGPVSTYQDLELSDSALLIKNGMLFGVIVQMPDLAESLRYARTADHDGHPQRLYYYREPKDPEDIENPTVTYYYYLDKRETGENTLS